jgi:hypothetical protein
MSVLTSYTTPDYREPSGRWSILFTRIPGRLVRGCGAQAVHFALLDNEHRNN